MHLLEIATPQRMNCGAWYKQAHNTFKQRLLDHFGGYTELPPAHGCWRGDDGKVYNDTMICYRVASTHGGAVTASLLYAAACECFPDQLAFFIAEIGKAEIINVKPETFKHAV